MTKKYAHREILSGFGEALREARKSQGLSQEKAADIMGSDRVTWSLIETAKRNISLVMAYRAAKAVNSDLHILIKRALDPGKARRNSGSRS